MLHVAVGILLDLIVYLTGMSAFRMEGGVE